MRQAIVVTDISFGDAGKGTTVDYLVRQANSAVVIRHNGGAQAAHNVVTPDGRHHKFAQFGSGSFVPGVLTHLSRFMLVNPLNMFPEAEHLRSVGVPDIWERISVDRNALIITPWQRSANRLRELARGDGRHGSCGQGIGETQADELEHPDMVIRAGDILDRNKLVGKLIDLRAAKIDQLHDEIGVGVSEREKKEWEVFTDPYLIKALCDVFTDWASLVQIVSSDYLATLADQHELLLFEGAQGVLLDEARGFHPYTTWSKTTPANALTLLGEIGYDGELSRYGVMRAYTTRHGPGPFVTEDQCLTKSLPEYHNGAWRWMGGFRVGYLDLLVHRYALAACDGIDALVVTGLDRLEAIKNWQYATRYQFEGLLSEAEGYFQFDPDRSVSDLLLGAYGDLDYQGRLTQLLYSCKPVYQAISTSSGMPDKQDELLRTIERELGLPIALVSAGPSAADKCVLTHIL